MTEIVFLSSLQGYQDARLGSLASRLRAEHPDLRVDVLDPTASAPILAKFKLKFGPAILINGRIEFVGVPRFRLLVERILTSEKRGPAPRSVMRPAAGKGGAGE
jgi:hypothetical protein